MQTPFEASGATQWTSRDDGEAFLDQIAASISTQVVQIGESVQGRPIRAALVGADPTTAQHVGMIVAAQHGNEPAGREGAYAFIRDLSQTTDAVMLDYLATTCWVIIPTVNTDRILATRENANNVNLNGDYGALSQPESVAVMEAIQEYKPVVLIDAHEGGTTFTEEVAAAIPSNNSVTSEIIDLSDQARAKVIEAVTSNGRTYEHFSGSTSPVILRNAAGLHHAVTVLLETYQNATNDIHAPARDFEERVEDQITAFYAILNHHRENTSVYRTVSDQSRWPLGPPSTGGGSGSVPFFTMWDTPSIYVGDKPIIDAYMNINGKQVRVIEQIPEILGT